MYAKYVLLAQTHLQSILLSSKPNNISECYRQPSHPSWSGAKEVCQLSRMPAVAARASCTDVRPPFAQTSVSELCCYWMTFCKCFIEFKALDFRSWNWFFQTALTVPFKRWFNLSGISFLPALNLQSVQEKDWLLAGKMGILLKKAASSASVAKEESKGVESL